MRVASDSRFKSITPRLDALMRAQLHLQRQVASGIRILRPEDDPAGFAIGAQHQVDASAAEQRQRLVATASTWVSATDGALEETLGAFHRAQELAIYGADGTKSPDDLLPMRVEVNGLLEQILSASSAKHRGHAVFGGTETAGAPFTAVRGPDGQITSVTHNGDGGERKVEPRRGVDLTMNILGSKETGGTTPAAFRDVSGADLFGVLIDLRDHLEAADVQAIMNDVGEIEAGTEQILTARSNLGAVQNLLDMSKTAEQNVEESALEALDGIYGVDIAEATMELAKIQAGYEAALAVSARVMQMSLLDYMR